jgi:hypothetical protein
MREPNVKNPHIANALITQAISNNKKNLISGNSEAITLL